MNKPIRLAARAVMPVCIIILLTGLWACATDESAPLAPVSAPDALVAPARVVAGAEIELVLSGDLPRTVAATWTTDAGSITADPQGRAGCVLWRAPAEAGVATVSVSLGDHRLEAVITVLASWCSLSPADVTFAPDSRTATVTMLNATGAEVPFTASFGLPWLAVEPAVGFLPPGETQFTLDVDREDVLIGQYVDRLGFDCGGVAVSGRVHVPVEGAAVVFTCVNHDPAYQNIRIKGSWTNWETREMERDGDVWTYREESLAPGSYEFGYVEDDGSEHGFWLLPPGPNFEVTVTADGVASGDLLFVIPAPPDQTTLTLICDMTQYPDPFTTVGVRGSFNGWDSTPTAMTDADGDGRWEVTLDVDQQADVIFKTVADGAIYEDVPADCGVDDGFGGFNRRLEIGTEPQTYPYPWAGCPAP